MKMHNDPGSWEPVREILHAWYKGETPLGAVMMAVLRIAYMGGGRKRMLLEGLLCGALTLTLALAPAQGVSELAEIPFSGDWRRRGFYWCGCSAGFCAAYCG